MKWVQSVVKRFGILLCLQLLVGMTLSGAGFAQGNAEKNQDVTAHQVLETTTKKLMLVITQAQKYYDQEPDRFYTEIEEILDEVVDFDSFARGVMGKYASKKAYKALATKEEKQAFRQRMDRFSSTFRVGLVQTYAKGLLAFNGNRIDVLPPNESAAAGDSDQESSVTVIQHIYGEAPKPYVVQYKMRKNKKAQWKLRNLTIEAINLGIIYRSQFYSAAKLYKGDIEKVIDNWSVDPTGKSTAAKAS